MNRTIYGLLLFLYPEDLRRRWGTEMTDTFDLQLRDARRTRGWTGVLQVWSCAFVEIFQIAAPLQAGRPELVAPVVSVAASGALFFGLMWALGNSLALLSFYHHALAKLGG